jgi:hypothetical protein
MTNKEHTSRPRIPRYAGYDRTIDIAFGSPDFLYPHFDELKNFIPDTRLYVFSPETPIARCYSPGTGEQMTITASTYRRVLKLQEELDGLPSGRILYIRLSEVPKGMFDWSEFPVEVLPSEDFDQALEIEGSLSDALNDPSSRVLVIDMERLWREHGGKPTYRSKKQPIRSIQRLNIP